MFTGIIKALGQVKKTWEDKSSLFLEIGIPQGWNLIEGSSVSTDGVCLTVREIKKDSYITELMPETVKKTKFKNRVPEVLNLEKSLSVGDSIDGHFVTGHVDSVGKIEKIEKEGRSLKFEISYPEEDEKFIVDRGSIALDGVSLTVSQKQKGKFSVNLVDHTIENTNFKFAKEGDLINIEYDMLGKYVLNK